jgi:hypothetical protein
MAARDQESGARIQGKWPQPTICIICCMFQKILKKKQDFTNVSSKERTKYSSKRIIHTPCAGLLDSNRESM